LLQTGSRFFRLFSCRFAERGVQWIEFRPLSRKGFWSTVLSGVVKWRPGPLELKNMKLNFQGKKAQKQRLAGCERFALVLAAVFALIPLKANAQLNSNIANVSLNATLNSSITITAAPGLVNFPLLRSGSTTGSSPISITTKWVLPVLFGTVKEYAYFTSSASALADGAGDNIPSANVSGSYNGGAFTAFTGASPFAAGSSMTLFSQFIFILFGNTSATRTDSLNLMINTTGLNLPAGTYTGVLHIQAQEI
jgi:hypothetical protein